jgi:hypothetical protein
VGGAWFNCGTGCACARCSEGGSTKVHSESTSKAGVTDALAPPLTWLQDEPDEVAGLTTMAMPGEKAMLVVFVG